MNSIDLFIIIFYLLVIFLIGIWSGKNIKNIKEFAVSDKSYSASVIFATLSASFIGGGFSFGNASKVFQYGLGYSTTLLGFSLMLILLSTLVVPRIGRFFYKSISVGDIMKTQYGKAGQIIAGVLGLLTCTGILAAQVGAMGAVLHIFLNVPFETGAYYIGRASCRERVCQNVYISVVSGPS